MTKTILPKPTISINIKDSSIMIHKNTLRILGNPEYIQILINPADKTIVVCCSSECDHLAHPVSREILVNNRKTLKIYSNALLQNLHKIYPKWTKDYTYRMTGEFFSRLNIVKFNMSDSSLSRKENKGVHNE